MKISEITEKIFDISDKITKSSRNPSINTFLIKKRLGQQKELNKFTTHRIKISDEFATELRKPLHEKLLELSEKKPNIKKFTDPSVLTEDLTVIHRDSLKTLSGLLNDLTLNDDGFQITSLQQMTMAKAYCYEAKVNNQRVYVFSEIDSLYIQREANQLPAKLKGDELKIMEDEIIIFSKNIFSIYFPDIEQLLIIDSLKTAHLLGFREQYKESATKTLKDLDIINVDKEFLDKELVSHEANQLIVHMDIEKRIVKELTYYKDYNKFYEGHKDLEELEKIVFDENDKIRIRNMHELKNFLNVADNRIVEGVVRKGEFSIAIKRLVLKKKGETK